MAGKQIEEIYAFVTLDDGDGNEGVLGFATAQGGWIPMIGADLAMVDMLMPRAEAMAALHPNPIELRIWRGPFELVKVIEPVGPADHGGQS